MNSRERLKALVERAAQSIGRTWMRTRAFHGTKLILAYHNVVGDHIEPQGDLSLHLRRSDLLGQLNEVSQYFDFVPLDRILDSTASTRPRAAITFDDAYHGALTNGWEVVRSLGLPATVFVTPAFLGGRTFWWDVLASPAHGLDPAIRLHVLEQLQGRDDAARRWAAESSLALLDVPAEFSVASEALLHEAVGQGLTVGAHSWSHPAMPRLTQSDLVEELRRPMAWLGERFGSSFTPWLAYPFGLSSSAVEVAAAEAGYRGAVLAAGGAFRLPSASPFTLPRVTVPAGVSVGGLHLRILGIRD